LRSAALLVAALLAACTVGPDFRTPDPPAAERYVPGPAPRLNVVVRDIPAQWWSVFESPAIDALVQRALANSPTLDVARARVTQAKDCARHARAPLTRVPT
jgi:outer membrane protein TolC